MHRYSFNTPCKLGKRVIKVFLFSQILLICQCYIYLFKINNFDRIDQLLFEHNLVFEQPRSYSLSLSLSINSIKVSKFNARTYSVDVRLFEQTTCS